MQWAKLPQSRTLVSRRCGKRNAIQHAFDKVPRECLLPVSFLFNPPRIFRDVLQVTSLKSQHFTALEGAFASDVLSVT